MGPGQMVGAFGIGPYLLGCGLFAYGGLVADDPTQNPSPAPAAEAPAPAARTPEPTPTPSRRSSSSVADDAQAFIDAAYAGTLTEPEGQPSDLETPPATPDPTPAVATAAEAGPEEAAAEDPSPAKKEPTRSEREAAARGKGKDKPADPAPVGEPSAPAKTPEQIIAEHEQQQREQRDREAAAERQRQEFASWTGNTPAALPDGTPATAYDRARAIADQPVPIIPYEATQEQWADYNRQLDAINAAKQEVAGYDRFRGFLDRVEAPLRQAQASARTDAEREAQAAALGWMSERFEAGITDAGVDLATVLAAGTAAEAPADKVPAMFRAFAEAIRSPLQAKIDDLEGDLAARDSEIDALRRQQGGRAQQPERGGVAASPSRGSLEALDAIPAKKLTLDDLDAYLDMLPSGDGRRRRSA